MADLIPTTLNANGVYALRDLEKVRLMFPMANVYGQVALSGVVVEGERGYRAERAAIRSLVLCGAPRSLVLCGAPLMGPPLFGDAGDYPHSAADMAQALSERYAVDVEIDAEFTRGQAHLLPGKWLAA